MIESVFSAPLGGRVWLLVSATLLSIGCRPADHQAVSAVPVRVETVRRTDVPRILQATGTAEPIRTAAVQAQISGQLLHVRFNEGDPVKAGEVLFEIDPRPFQAALDEAMGPLVRDQAQLANAERDLARYQSLSARNYVTAQQVDQMRATAEALAGTLQADSAAYRQAQLNLQHATIHAPIFGRAGSVLVKEGNQVRGNADQTLVVINQISPILVRFPVPATAFSAVRERATDRLDVVAAPVGDLAPAHAQHGTLVFLDNAVDSLTGTVTLKARFMNPDGLLWPGALESVSLQLDVERNALVVPQAAVQTGQGGSVVWIVDSASRAHAVKVHVTGGSDSLAVVGGGLRPGQSVVIDGQLRLTDGVRVSIESNADSMTHDSAISARPGGDR